jgi:hypothetical protein
MNGSGSHFFHFIAIFVCLSLILQAEQPEQRNKARQSSLVKEEAMPSLFKT